MASLSYSTLRLRGEERGGLSGALGGWGAPGAPLPPLPGRWGQPPKGRGARQAAQLREPGAGGHTWGLTPDREQTREATGELAQGKGRGGGGGESAQGKGVVAPAEGVPVILRLQELELILDAIAGLGHGELEPRLPRLVGGLGVGGESPG